jgi:hypothetical protein
MFPFREYISRRFLTKAGIARIPAITMMLPKVDIFHIALQPGLVVGFALIRKDIYVLTKRVEAAGTKSHGGMAGKNGLSLLDGEIMGTFGHNMMILRQLKSSH